MLTVFIGRGFCFPTQLIFKLVLCTQMYITSANANLVVLCTSHSELIFRKGGLVLAFLVCLLCVVLFLIFVTSELALVQMLKDRLLNPSQQFPERWSHFIFSNLFWTTTVHCGSLSMPEKKVRSQDRRKEEKSREQRKIRKGTCRNQPHWWESFLGSSCLDTGRLCPFHHWIVMSDFDSVGPWKLHSE